MIYIEMSYDVDEDKKLKDRMSNDKYLSDIATMVYDSLYRWCLKDGSIISADVVCKELMINKSLFTRAITNLKHEGYLECRKNSWYDRFSRDEIYILKQGFGAEETRVNFNG